MSVFIRFFHQNKVSGKRGVEKSGSLEGLFVYFCPSPTDE
jgi:hypothetical protein